MIKVLINSSSRYPVERKRIRQLVKKILGSHLTNKETEVSILFCGDRKMTWLNSKWLGRQGTTNVLSFPLKASNYPDKVFRLGDIVISYPQVRKQAAENEVTVDEEVDRMVEHGLLSLLGLHHE